MEPLVRSSISNSKAVALHFPVRIVVLTLVLFCLYTAVVAMWSPQIVIGQHQGQDNIVRAETFLYRRKPPENVVVGSSMAARLRNDMFGSADVMNLAMSAGSSITGLELVLRSGRLPRVVIVETNISDAVKELDLDFLAQLDPGGFKQKFRGLLPSLQVRFQPVTLLFHFAWTLRGQQALEASQLVPVDEVLRKQLIVGHRQNFSVRVNESLLSERVDRLDGAISDLQNRGVRVLAFELPMEPELMKSVAAVQVREAFHHLLQKLRVSQVTFDGNASWETTDGIHLHWAACKRAASAIAGTIEAKLQ